MRHNSVPDHPREDADLTPLITHIGRIAFGGGGIILSRSLVEKMQLRVDECAEKFQHVTGGDGMIVRTL